LLNSQAELQSLTTDLTVWSNFEIADMDFWRGPAYTDFFNFLDATGGFYYEV
jgi:Glycolipid 2-alpha-mannosyltransferase